MKKYNIIICNVLFLLVSCSTTVKDKENIVLKDFTRNFVDLYVEDDIESINANTEIIINTHVDSLVRYISVYSVDNSTYEKLCKNDLLAVGSYKNYNIRIHGDYDTTFYTLKHRYEGESEEKFYEDTTLHDVLCFNPKEWTVALYNDNSFSKILTNRYFDYNEDISQIQKLAEMYFDLSDTTPDWVVLNTADTPSIFKLGIDSLKTLCNIHCPNTIRYSKIIVEFFIDKNGMTKINRSNITSKDSVLYNKVCSVANIICNHGFTPAVHRGEKVNFTFAVEFDVIK